MIHLYAPPLPNTVPTTIEMFAERTFDMENHGEASFEMLQVASIVAEAERTTPPPPPIALSKPEPVTQRQKRAHPQKSPQRPPTFEEAVQAGVFCLNPEIGQPEYSLSAVLRHLQTLNRAWALEIESGSSGSDSVGEESDSTSTSWTFSRSGSDDDEDDEISSSASTIASSQKGMVRPATPNSPQSLGQGHAPSPKRHLTSEAKTVIRPPAASPPPPLNGTEYSEYFPGGPRGVHLAPATPTSLEHRLGVFERILAKRRSGQSIGGVRPGNPLDVCEHAGAEFLTDSEIELCAGLRLTPGQYFHSRRVLLNNYWRQGWFNKSAAQKMLRIDVNKTGKVWEFLVKSRWMPESPESSEKILPPPHDLDK